MSTLEVLNNFQKIVFFKIDSDILTLSVLT